MTAALLGFSLQSVLFLLFYMGSLGVAKGIQSMSYMASLQLFGQNNN